MAEMQASSNKKYRLKKVRDCWFLENSYTLKTKRLPFLSEKVKINLEDNYIFADDNVYEIKETDRGDTRIKKIEDLVYSSENEVGGISASIKETGSDQIEHLVYYSSVQEVDRISEYIKETGSDKIEDFVYYSSVQEVDIISESIKETKSDKNKDLADSSELDVDEISSSISEVNIRSHESGSAEYVDHSSIDGPYLYMKDRGTLPRAQRKAVVTFQVILNDSKLAKLCELRGEMELLVNENGFSFYNTKSKYVTYTFSNRWIRRFRTSGPKRFTFEVGRRCPAGEGEIVVTTDKSARLNEITKRIWKIDDKQ